MLKLCRGIHAIIIGKIINKGNKLYLMNIMVALRKADNIN